MIVVPAPINVQLVKVTVTLIATALDFLYVEMKIALVTSHGMPIAAITQVLDKRNHEIHR